MLIDYFISISKTNNLADFKPPYKIVGKVDYEILKERYLRLHNKSFSVYKRHLSGW